MSFSPSVNNLFETNFRTTPNSRSQKSLFSMPSREDQSSCLTSTQHLPSKQTIDSTEVRRKQYSMADNQIAQDIVKVLREENLNLKKQNNFLLENLRTVVEKEKEVTQLALKQEEIVGLLRIENEELKTEFEYVNELANSKVEEIGKKLAKLSTEEDVSEQNIDLRDLNPPRGILDLRSVQSVQSESEKMEPNEQDDFVIQNVRSLEDLNNEFEAILYSCKVEKNTEKRKEYRRRLVELTERMKKIRK